ncbi:K(+)-stimulated pyrophosphate-energized sodium pump [Nocardiopsis flavescens]|uniref:K(+)-insensitive pyrophosphate-energized proton pump n=1 Tax=Nocardiopsis flavescens TaxID=758803 RepID=A0A1M6RXT6_9ACTN|nr:sodium-translocating pyrophosphatase [Nocardiopsis flavescens]SHK37322.1 K(+)-stimulated pyrophosphate-energized sodium pump [Nocardiopsis flavescens]
MSGLNLAAPSGTALELQGIDLTLVIVVMAVALLALAVAGMLVREVLAAGQGTERMRNIAVAVQEGAGAYLRRQFRTLAVFVVIIPLLLLLLPADSWAISIGRSVFFALGAVLSAATGFIGMWLAVRGNVRVAAAARGGTPEDGRTAMRIAFRTGGVAGMITVGLGLLGAAVVVLLYRGDAPIVLEGFGFGAALLAMFMRVGGGIFTKAADVGADLVGKVEQGIPEDDPRNAATIADNVGDNVGDCAGMAADLFESYAVVLVASLILGRVAFGVEGLVFPLLVPMIGVLTAIIGIFIVAPAARDKSAMSAINRGFFISAGISALLVVGTSFWYLPASFQELSGVSQSVLDEITEASYTGADPRLIAIAAVLIGLVLAAAIQLLTGYFTETDKRPVREIGESSETGAATVILSGISVGLESAVYSALLIAGAVYAAFLLGGGSITLSLFAVALAGTGLLTTVGIIVAMDTFGPVSDNAQGIAEMSGDVEGEGAEILTGLDAVGNTTKAITKGIAIATAVLAATALFGAFRTSVQEQLSGDEVFSLSLDRPDILVGVIIGASVVFFFSGLAIMAVGRAAGRVVMEVREQFRTRPGIMDGTEKPEYARVVDICTRDSLRELITPGLLAVLAPIAVGFALGYAPLGAFLGGAIAAGVLMAVFLANSGGAWDNAKKLVEDGHHGGKGSDAHSATVIGDTVGDPFKDTAGPAINPLLKVMNLVALIIAPSVVIFYDNAVLRAVVTGLAVAILVGAVLWSKRRGAGNESEPAELGLGAPESDDGGRVPSAEAPGAEGDSGITDAATGDDSREEARSN